MKTTASSLSPRYLLTTRRFLVLAVVLGTAAVLILFGAAIPLVKASLDEATTLQKQQAIVVKLAEKKDQLAAIPLLPDYELRTEQVNQVLPSKKPLLELLTSLNTVVQQSQVTVTNIELSPGGIASQAAEAAEPVPSSAKSKKKAKTSSGSKDYDTMDVLLTAEGTLSQLNLFLQGVEKIAPASTVTSLALSKPIRQAANQMESTFEAKLLITSFYFTKPITATIEGALPIRGSAEDQVLKDIENFTYPTAAQPELIQGGGLQDLFGIEN